MAAFILRYFIKTSGQKLPTWEPYWTNRPEACQVSEGITWPKKPQSRSTKLWLAPEVVPRLQNQCQQETGYKNCETPKKGAAPGPPHLRLRSKAERKQSQRAHPVTSKDNFPGTRRGTSRRTNQHTSLAIFTQNFIVSVNQCP